MNYNKSGELNKENQSGQIIQIDQAYLTEHLDKVSARDH